MISTLKNKKALKNNSKENKAVKTSLRKESIKKDNRKNNRRNNGRNIGSSIAGDSEVCPFCGSADFIIDSIRSEVTCRSCGVVLEENIIDFTPSGTSINRDGQNLNQNGAPCSIDKHDNGLSTDFDLKFAPKNDFARWSRLKKLNNQSKINGSRERNLSRAFNELSLLISRLSLPKDVKKEAAAIYRRALEKDLIRGRNINLIITASLYASCRRCRVPRTLDEIAEVTSFSKKSVAKTYRLLSRELSLNLPPVSPVDYVPRFVSELKLSSQMEVKSREIIDLASDLGLIAGKTPNGVAAAALYCSSILLGERITQSEIASVVGVTEVTIRARYKELKEGLNL